MDQFEVPKKRIFPKIFWPGVMVFLVVTGILFVKAYSFGSKVFVRPSSFAKKVYSLVFSGGSAALQGEAQNRINILLLGYGGEGHDGPYLTDTLMLASINPSTKQISLTSIPRDYYWPQGAQKINYAFSAGYEKNKSFDTAGETALKAANQITGLAIPYFSSVDFTGFQKAVDRVGGLDITIDNAFTDSQYPNDANLGYIAPITFTAGTEHMDGKRALEFARSRHGNNNEDSDFARSKRQEKIINAFKTKVQKLGLLSSSGTINDLLNIVADHARTNIEPSELLHLAKIIRDPQIKITSQSLDLNSNLICPSSDDKVGYILIPCPGISDQQIKNYFANSFRNSAVTNEAASIILENAGANQNDFDALQKELSGLGASVYVVPYKGLPLDVSALYQVNPKPDTIKYLQRKLNVQSQPKPDTMKAQTDIVIFLGKN